MSVFGLVRLLAAALTAASLVQPAAAQDNSCRYAFDAECDEPSGTGLCGAGTDSFDCRGQGVAGPNDCFWAYDGECDEAQGTGVCPAGSDAWDCRQAGKPPGPDACPFAFDGECDEPQGTGVCLAGTDTTDCLAPQRTIRADDPRTFFGHDDREFVDANAYPWSAVGKLVFATGGHCSGALVGPRLVLTAAHCLFVEEKSARLDIPTEFLAGLSGTRAVAEARIVDYAMAPGYDLPLHSRSSEIDGLDWAFLMLDRDIGAVAGTFDIHPVTAEELLQAVEGQWFPVTQAGYGSDSSDRMTAHIGCPILEVFSDNTIFHQCDTLEGSSGSPLFVEIDGEYLIVALESAVYLNDDAKYDSNMAVDARAFYDAWRRLSAGKPLR